MSADPAPVVPVRSPEVIFEVTEAVEGGYEARAFGHSVYTQGKDIGHTLRLMGWVAN